MASQLLVWRTLVAHGATFAAFRHPCTTSYSTRSWCYHKSSASDGGVTVSSMDSRGKSRAADEDSWLAEEDVSSVAFSPLSGHSNVGANTRSHRPLSTETSSTGKPSSRKHGAKAWWRREAMIVLQSNKVRKNPSADRLQNIATILSHLSYHL